MQFINLPMCSTVHVVRIYSLLQTGGSIHEKTLKKTFSIFNGFSMLKNPQEAKPKEQTTFKVLDCLEKANSVCFSHLQQSLHFQLRFSCRPHNT